MSVISIKKTSAAKSACHTAGRLFVLIVVPVLAGIGFFYIYNFNPAAQTNPFLACPLNAATGLYCPGCGNTRALHALVHLDWIGMLNYNLLFPFVFAILTWLLAGEYLNFLLGRRILWLPKRVPVIWIILFCLVVTAFTILRNVPIYPFTILAP